MIAVTAYEVIMNYIELIGVAKSFRGKYLTTNIFQSSTESIELYRNVFFS
jgi:hypothetical protein